MTENYEKCLYTYLGRHIYMHMYQHDAKRLEAILRVQSEIKKTMADYLKSKDFIEISPVILSPITDPLNHPTAPADIKCYGKTYRLMQSMIFHKQIAMRYLEKIFVFSPNIRIEPVNRRKTGRHLFEFTQLDVEAREATREGMIKLCETLITRVIKIVNNKYRDELTLLGRKKLQVPKKPFKRIKYDDAYTKYGKEFETKISQKNKHPIWITDIPLQHREFYDREDPKKPGYLRDMDLLYPEGYGEALSGGEREYQYEKIKEHIKKKGQRLSDFQEYLQIAKHGLPPSAGFGIGIERLTRFICGLKRIEETSLFPKTPGKTCL
ncbi:MAG: asparagine synthetase [Thermoplasmata archaeon]|nr:MAG: asparagine synthetase [Thermoplasmata archaeon]